jgi:hypothetical protein
MNESTSVDDRFPKKSDDATATATYIYPLPLPYITIYRMWIE